MGRTLLEQPHRQQGRVLRHLGHLYLVSRDNNKQEVCSVHLLTMAMLKMVLSLVLSVRLLQRQRSLPLFSMVTQLPGPSTTFGGGGSNMASSGTSQQQPVSVFGQLTQTTTTAFPASSSSAGLVPSILQAICPCNPSPCCSRRRS